MMDLKTAVPSASEDLFRLMQSAFVIDTETTIAEVLEPGCKFAASPHSVHNEIVALGVTRPSLMTGHPVAHIEYSGIISHKKNYHEFYAAPDYIPVEDQFRMFMAGEITHNAMDPDATSCLYIGHNIAFDLQYLMRDMGGNWSTTLIWDTMLAEKYLLNQQYGQYSLEAVCEQRGIQFKKDATVNDSFKLGIGADRIHPETLMKYLFHDVKATDELFKIQHEAAVQIGGIKYVRYLMGLMSARMATMRMEMKGIYIDMDKFKHDKKIQEDENDLYEKRVRDAMIDHFPSNVRTTPSAASSKQLKAFMFGGSVECDEQVPVLDKDDGSQALYKSGPKKGMKKFKRESVQEQVPAYITSWPRGMKPNSTDDKTLQDLIDHYVAGSGLAPTVTYALELSFLTNLQKYRSASKNLSTYYEGMEKHIWTGKDDCIHPQYNHGIAVTKRLTSSKPNMQNVSNKGDK